MGAHAFCILFAVIGFVLGLVIRPYKTSGTLKVDTSFIDKEYYLMEFTEDLDTVKNRKYIILKVNNKAKLRK